ncbi:MAG: Glu-tRNA(Gln) amidotransferase subunit GatD [Candidatus Thermoplasmatota archaeon]|jgi:glutamyl-tRNA(Gln) amidotransferase subunit D|nr:Glu-tRNA(Gln) amidotransferase subunit GatD [Candidatus Thermoplasmatota archaeon]
MTKKRLIEDLLKNINAEDGDKILVETKNFKKEGILMPHHQFSDNDIITIKLDNGYNIGVAVDNDTKITLLEKHKHAEKKYNTITFDENKPTVSIIGTGGTIACYVDYRTGAVHPATNAQELAFSVPEIFDICNIKVHVAFQLLSENIQVSNWKILAEKAAKELNNGSQGVIIPHGTDTLGYTAAALSFMLKDLTGPVVLVGAQRSSDRPSSDAAQNQLAAATLAAKSDIGEVVVVMHGEISDTYVNIHRGTKVRKFHTSRRDAFKSVNEKTLGKIENGEIKIFEKYRKKTTGKVTVDEKMEEDVAMVYSYPGLKPSDIPEKKGIVLIGTGLGHVPKNVFPRIKQLIDNGSIIVMTSQCIFGRVNMNVYSTGRDLLSIGVIPCEDMLPETAYVKLMWVLGHTKKKEDAQKLMLTNIAGEISKRTSSTVFL